MAYTNLTNPDEISSGLVSELFASVPDPYSLSIIWTDRKIRILSSTLKGVGYRTFFLKVLFSQTGGVGLGGLHWCINCLEFAYNRRCFQVDFKRPQPINTFQR